MAQGKKYPTEEERIAARRASAVRAQKKYKDTHPEYAKKQNAYKGAEKARKYRAKHPEYMKDYHLRYRYGITLDEYNKMFDAQMGCCAGCGVHQSELSKPLYLDHDHVTERPRGLLCHNCNTVLGHVKDNKSVLQSLLSYLGRYSI
jgi:hypothetical protein